MTFNIILSLRAQQDIKNSYDWYEEELSGLGSRFIISIGNDFDIISINPEAFPISKNGFRQKTGSEFPFLIIYKLKAKQTINIIRVFHTSRNPKYKYRRK